MTKVTVIPDEDLVVALMEAPNFEYIDKTSPAVNTICLLDKNTMQEHSSYHFKKEELPNCLFYFEKKA